MFSQLTFVAKHNINGRSIPHMVTGTFSQFQSDLHMLAVACCLQSTLCCDHHNITEMQQGTSMHSVHIHIKLDCFCHCEGHTGAWAAVYCCGLDQSVAQVLLKISYFQIWIFPWVSSFKRLCMQIFQKILYFKLFNFNKSIGCNIVLNQKVTIFCSYHSKQYAESTLEARECHFELHDVLN